jgi:hypothetical protein
MPGDDEARGPVAAVLRTINPITTRFAGMAQSEKNGRMVNWEQAAKNTNAAKQATGMEALFVTVR